MDTRRGAMRAMGAVAVVLLVGLLAAACTAGGGTDERSEPPEDTPRTAVRSSNAPSNYLCLACHNQKLTSTPGVFGVGHELQAVAPGAFFTSAHGDMACVECHQQQTALPHEKFSASGEPLALAGERNACRTCHGGAAEEFLDSVHGTVIRLGDEHAPACTDCHSVHAVQPITTWTASEKASACAKCHDGADEAFAGCLTHVEPTVDRLPIDFIATRFFGALVVAVVGIGILHVELDMLRWLKEKLTRKSREGK